MKAKGQSGNGMGEENAGNFKIGARLAAEKLDQDVFCNKGTTEAVPLLQNLAKWSFSAACLEAS
jgi:hypothetical protein